MALNDAFKNVAKAADKADRIARGVPKNTPAYQQAPMQPSINPYER